MKKVASLLVGLAMMSAGSAWAIPTTWSDKIDFNPDILIPPAYSYTHNIADDGFKSFFMGGNDTISSYDLKISLYDDNQPSYLFGFIRIPDGSEAATIWSTGGIYSYNFALTSNTYTGNFLGNVDLWADGRLCVDVSQALLTFGDFYLASSELTAYGDNGSAPVPEPSTIMLLGAGFLGLAAYGKRRKNA
jgi:hypothetical protein